MLLFFCDDGRFFLFSMLSGFIDANDDHRDGRKCHASVLVVERGDGIHEESGDCGHQNHDNDGHVVLQDNKNAGRSSRPWCQCGVEAFWIRSSLFPVESRGSDNILFMD
ncbi:hypothetical protein SEVIR_9G253400v4 [Setaria viridis]|uniref:Uncharacterized protein n=1 Tax=Setaria viridis TaxID=4556 RepID=A0A4U6SXJ2_SETVI|nr:hypothetical protein SEVIR_9G253400v2 [Setaria viridis]